MMRIEQEEREEQEMIKRAVLGPDPLPGQIVYGPNLPENWIFTDPPAGLLDNQLDKPVVKESKQDLGLSRKSTIVRQESNKNENREPQITKKSNSIVKKESNSQEKPEKEKESIQNTKEKEKSPSPVVKLQEERFRLIKTQTGESLAQLPAVESPDTKIVELKVNRLKMKSTKGLESLDPLEGQISLGLENENIPLKVEDIVTKKKNDIIKTEKVSVSSVPLNKIASNVPSTPTTGQLPIPLISKNSALVSTQVPIQPPPTYSAVEKSALLLPGKSMEKLAINHYSAFTIKEITEPDHTHSIVGQAFALGNSPENLVNSQLQHPNSFKQFSQNVDKTIQSLHRIEEPLGFESVNQLLTVGVQSQALIYPMEMLRQNEQERVVIVSKPNFSNMLLTREILQEMHMKKEEERLDINNREVVILETKKYQELYDMIKAENCLHTETVPTEQGGWMVFNAEGEARKDRDKIS